MIVESRYSYMSKRFLYLFPMLMFSLSLLFLGADYHRASLFLCFLTGVGLVYLSLKILFFSPKIISSQHKYFVPAIVAIIGFMIFAAKSQGVFLGSEHEYFLLVTLLLVFSLGVEAGSVPNGIYNVMTGVIAIAAVYCVYSFFQYVFFPNYILSFEKPYHQDRLTGLFLSANTAASLYGVFIFISLADIYVSMKQNELDVSSNRLIMSVFVFGISCVCLLLSRSVGGLGALLIAMAGFIVSVMFYKTLRPSDELTFGVFALTWTNILVLSVVAYLMLYFAIFPFNGELIQKSFAERKDMVKVLMNAAMDNKWLGYGMGQLETAKLAHLDGVTNYNAAGQNAAHNVVFQWIIQAGWIVSIALFLFCGVIIAKLIKGLERESLYWPYVLAILAIVIFVGIHNMYDYSLEIPSIALLLSWLMGTGLGYIEQTRLAKTHK